MEPSWESLQSPKTHSYFLGLRFRFPFFLFDSFLSLSLFSLPEFWTNTFVARKKMSSITFFHRLSSAFRDNQSHLKLVLLCTAVRYRIIYLTSFFALFSVYYLFHYCIGEKTHLSFSFAVIWVAGVLVSSYFCFTASFTPLFRFFLKEKLRSVHCYKYEI